MTYAAYLIPIFAIVLLIAWILLICKALREEHDYLWVVLLVFIPPVGVPLYLVNFYFLGDRQRGLGALKTQKRLWREAAELEAQIRHEAMPADRERLAGLYFELEQWEQCLQVLRPALDHDPEDLRLQYLAARALLSLKKLEPAVRHLEYIVETDPRYANWRVMLTLAQVLQILERREEALHWYDELAKNVTFPEALYFYARANWDTPRREEMREVLEHMVKSYEKDPAAHPREDGEWIDEARRLLES